MRVRSMVGLIPLFAVDVLGAAVLDKLDDFRTPDGVVHSTTSREVAERGRALPRARRSATAGSSRSSIPSSSAACSPRMLDESEFLSPARPSLGVAVPRRSPVRAELPGRSVARVDYEPARVEHRPLRGNSNWRGPVWFPVNYLVIEALRRFHALLRRRLHRRVPDGLGPQLHRSARSPTRSRAGWSRIFLRRRAVGGPSSAATSCSSATRAWHDLLLFHEYFHGDDGTGLGASPPDRLDRPGGGHAGGAIGRPRGGGRAPAGHVLPSPDRDAEDGVHAMRDDRAKRAFGASPAGTAAFSNVHRARRGARHPALSSFAG